MKTRVSYRDILVLVAVAIGSTALSFALDQIKLLKVFELRTVDFRFQKNVRPDKIPPEILMLGIGDQALEQLGRWPWPRDYHADFLFRLAPLKPKAVGYDVLFSEPDERDPAADFKLAAALSQYPSIVFGAALKEKEKVALGPHPPEPEKQWIEKNSFADTSGDGKKSPEGPLILPAPIFRPHVKSGQVDLPRDADGVARRIPLVSRNGDRWLPHLALRLVCEYLDVPPDKVVVEPGRFVILSPPAGPPVKIPIDAEGRMTISFRAKYAGFNPIKYNDADSVLKTPEDPRNPSLASRMGGSIVLVGFTATGVDVLPTPLDANSPGMAVIGSAMATILSGDFIRTPSLGWDVAARLMFFGVIFGLARFLPTRFGAATALGVVCLYVWLLWMAFAKANMMWPVVAPVLTALAVIFVETTIRLVQEAKEKLQIRSTFGRYLSKNVLDMVLDDPKVLKLGGVRREMTVLFSDIQGFTTFCEQHEPEDVVPILNEALDSLTPVIFEHEGTLDKYIGDAIMAFWSAPREQPDHALRAVRAAMQMQRELSRLREKWKSEGKPELKMGVGINTGPMLVGNMGSSQLMSYTIIGDAVNLGARVEGLTRKYDTDIVITETTFDQVKDQLECELLEEVTVKGKAKPIKVYKVIRERGHVTRFK
ncbi:MAG: adenylate/guanylate cyclase domain-containing protein [Verrucomicrobiae bacterium]|nr:adenylate/guanylate cyclase domain-containing protein [Verrucomicrobiae bacterium]